MPGKFDDLIPLKKDSYKPLYAQVSEALESYIRDKNLISGDPLPSENDIVQFYGVSRMTARIAFQRLVTEGLITKVQGKGTFVAEKKITGFIRGVRPLEESFADQGITVVTEPLEVEVRPNPTQLYLTELNLSPEATVFRILRLKKIGPNPLAVENRYLPLDVAERFPVEDLRQKPLLELLDSNPETEVQRVVYGTRSELLLARYAELLEAPEGTPGLIQRATYFNRRERPVMTGSMVYLASRIELRYEFRRQDNSWVKQQRVHEIPPPGETRPKA